MCFIFLDGRCRKVFLHILDNVRIEEPRQDLLL
jgi:hypothetical protein